MTNIISDLDGTTNIFDSASLQAIESATLSAYTSTQFTLSGDGFTLTAQGSGIGYSGGHPHSGTVTSLSFDIQGVSGAWSGFSLSVSAVWSALSSGDTATFDNLFFGGNDTFNLGIVNFVNGYGGDDVFNCNAGFNFNDQIDGGPGNDTLNLDTSAGGASISASNLINVENIVLTGGHSYALTLQPGLVPAGATMTVNASSLQAGASLHFDGTGNAALLITGGAGDDYMRGGIGNDTFNGGAGSDTVDFSLGTSGSVINLNVATQTIGGLGTDTLNSIENIIGTPYNDTLTGNASDNTFDGGGGHDVIDGGAGNDTVSYKFANEYSVTVDLNITGPQKVDYWGDTQTLTSIENIIGSVGNDTFTGTSGDNIFNGGGGSDTVSLIHATGGATIDDTGTNPVVAAAGLGNDTYISISGFIGTNFDDTLITNSLSYPSFDGGAGYDTVDFSHATAPAFVEDNRLQNVENIVGSSYDDVIYSSASRIDGGAGNDGLSGSAGAAIFGGTGDDTIYFPGSSGEIDGGSGNDTVYMGGGNDTPIVLTPATMVNVETLILENINGLALKTDDATVAAGATLTVSYYDPAVYYGQKLTFDGSAETNGNFIITSQAASDTLIGGAGNDTLDSGAGDDTIDISHGGNDIVRAGYGNDTIIVNAALTAADTIDGGPGIDTVVLNGDYSAGLTVAAPILTNIEKLQLAGGHNYKLTMGGGNLVAGETFTVDGLALKSGDALIFDGSSEANGNYTMIISAGTDVLTGSNGIDTIKYTYAKAGVSVNLSLSAAQVTGIGTETLHSIENAVGTNYNDTLVGNSGTTYLSGGEGDDVLDFGGAFTNTSIANGGNGNDTLKLNGDYSAGLNFSANALVSIETLQLAGGHSYALSISDVNLQQNNVNSFTADGSALGVGDSLTFDASHVLSLYGYLVISGGGGNDILLGGNCANNLTSGDGGNDTLRGGVGSDVLNFGGSLTAADVADGGGGPDTLELDGDYSAGVVFSPTTMVNIENLKLYAGHDYVLATDDANIAAGQTFTVDGSALGANDALTFDGSREKDARFSINTGDGLNVLSGGAGNDNFNFGSNFTTADAINGGAGNDTLVLSGDYSTVFTFTATTMVNVETLQLSTDIFATGGYKLIMNDANVAAGQTLTVDASRAFGLIFDGSQETDGNFVVIGGGGSNNFFMGGAGNDILNGGVGAGISTVSYADAAGGVNVSLLVTTGQAVGGGEGTDTLISIENLTGSNFGDTLHGNSTNNVLSGLGGNDTFYMGDGGIDTVSGGDGNDTIFFGTALTVSDIIDGGIGSDTLGLNGDYTGANAVVFAPTTMTNIENISFSAGHSYNLTTNDANVAAGQTLTVKGSALGATDALTFNGSQETDGKFVIYGGAGADVLKGGSGNDTFNMGSFLTTTDVIDAGAGTDTLSLDGNYTGAKALVFNATTVAHVENVSLTAGHSYDLTTNSASVAAGQTMTINGALLGASDTLTFNGAGETNGNFVIKGGAGDDALVGGSGSDMITGGAGNDMLTGGLGADQLNGGSGANIFVYKNAAQSTGAHYDTITGFDFATDKFNLTFAVSAIDTKIAGGTLSAASFDTDLAAAVDAAHLGKHHAVLFTPDSGDLAGDTFLIIDTNRVAGYQAGKDIVIQLYHSGHLASLDVTDFI